MNGSSGDNHQKIKVLALHGYLQNADTFRKKTGSLVKGLKSLCEIVYIEGPFMAVALNEEDSEDVGGLTEGGRSWWQWSDESSVPVRPSQAHHYTGLDVMVDHIMAAISLHKPQGIIGFSQGATATALALTKLQELGDAGDAAAGTSTSSNGHLSYPGGTLQFAILVGAFLPRDEEAAAMVSRSRPHLTTLFVTGEKDRLVPTERTEKLMECFGGPTTKLLHPGGHWVPTCSGDIKRQFMEFINQSMKKEQDEPLDR